jgi:hypothetical protein
MPDYLKPIKNSDSPLVKVSKYILASYSMNDNIKSVLIFRVPALISIGY